MKTLTEVANRFDIEVPEHLLSDIEVPVLTNEPQCQGDVSIFPTRAGKVEGLAPVPSEGIPVVRGEAGGNTHLLIAEGPVSFAPKPNGLVLGVLRVEEGGTAHLIHPEHGMNSMGGPCDYTIGRQQEQAEVIRVVSD